MGALDAWVVEDAEGSGMPRLVEGAVPLQVGRQGSSGQLRCCRWTIFVPTGVRDCGVAGQTPVDTALGAPNIPSDSVTRPGRGRGCA